MSLDYSPLVGTLDGFGEIIVIANDAGAGIDSATGIPNPNTQPDTQGVIQEYSRHNNIASLAVTNEFAGFSLSGELDKTHYTANETVKITSIPTNLGSFSVSPSVKISILDSVGNIISEYPAQTVNLGVALLNQPLMGENGTTLQNTWKTAQNRVGNYTAKIELIHQNHVVASVNKPFAIVADGVIGHTNTGLGVNKTEYAQNDLVQIHSRLMNTASNAMANAREVTLNVTFWTKTYNYHEFSPNAIHDQYFTLPLKNAVLGDYTVTSITTAPDGSQNTQTLQQQFKVSVNSETAVNISGNIHAKS